MKKAHITYFAADILRVAQC